ncbi:hypothetical protein QQ045_009790 [Rhodiola kirilowii]
MEMSVDQNQGNNEEGNVVVIDRIIKVTEVSYIETKSNNIPRAKLDSLERSMLELDQASFRDGESNVNSSCTENGGVKANEQVIEQSEGRIISDEITEANKDEEIVYHDKEKQIGARTRSRQKA